MALGPASFGLSNTWQSTTIALALTSVAMSVIMVVCPMVCGNTLRNTERVTGMQLCDTVSSLPRLAAPVVAAYIITRSGGMTAGGIRPLFWFSSVGYIAAFVFVYLYFINPATPSSNRDGILLASLECLKRDSW